MNVDILGRWRFIDAKKSVASSRDRPPTHIAIDTNVSSTSSPILASPQIQTWH